MVKFAAVGILNSVIVILTDYWLFSGNVTCSLVALLNLNRFLSYGFINQSPVKVTGVVFAKYNF